MLPFQLLLLTDVHRMQVARCAVQRRRVRRRQSPLLATHFMLRGLLLLHPWMCQYLLAIVPCSDVHVHQMLHQILRFLGHCRPRLVWKRETAMLDQIEQLPFLLVVRWMPDQHQIQNHTNRPIIDLKPISATFLARQHLWCQKQRCTTHCRQRFLIAFQESRQSKIGDFYVPRVFIRQQNVFRFEIAMCNLVAMQIHERIQQLSHDVACIGLAQFVFINNALKEFAAHRHLEHNI
mmetsp:Transcript_10911/g.16479  ORF Transcript_10911/g.16479 Transcript_10911/m.16479 type:complete len:235 (-) Transcript_10911:782-1486(-)